MGILNFVTIFLVGYRLIVQCTFFVLIMPNSVEILLYFEEGGII